MLVNSLHSFRLLWWGRGCVHLVFVVLPLVVRKLGISRSELVPLSSVGVPRLVVADGRPMPVLDVVPRLKLSLGTLSPETVRVVVVKSLCGADVILGSDFLLASGATVCLGSVPPSLSLASGTIPIRFNEIEPVAVHCEVSVEVPGDVAQSFSSSVSSVVDPPAVARDQVF